MAAQIDFFNRHTIACATTNLWVSQSEVYQQRGAESVLQFTLFTSQAELYRQFCPTFISMGFLHSYSSRVVRMCHPSIKSPVEVWMRLGSVQRSGNKCFSKSETPAPLGRSTSLTCMCKFILRAQASFSHFACKSWYFLSLSECLFHNPKCCYPTMSQVFLTQECTTQYSQTVSL